MKKRGYFFTVDVTIAMIIIVIGFLLVWSFYISETRKIQPYFYSQDIIDYLSTNTLASVSGTTPYVNKLIKDGNITTLDNTLLEQIALFYMNREAGWQLHLAENLTRNSLVNILPEQYGADILLNRTVLYSKSSNYTSIANESDVLISAKKMVVVVFNKVNLSDPYMMEVRVWR